MLAEAVTARLRQVPGARPLKTAGLVLAAGGGFRFGQPKAGIEIGGRRLMDLAIDSCVRAGLDPVVVVLGAVWLTPRLPTESADGDTAGGDNADIRLVENADWATGLASSLRAGLGALTDDLGTDAVVVTLVDTPSVGEDHLRRVVSALRDGATAVVATYQASARLPVGLTREVWADVAASAVGDEGARVWLRAHPQLVTEVECADLGSWTDIDLPGDLPGDLPEGAHHA